jgi:RNA polymerase sigma factor (TIGR02999 family)
MSEVTRLLTQIDSGDALAAEQLLPLIYDELRKLAAARLAAEKPGQTLQATALVHEAWLRVTGAGRPQPAPTEDESAVAGRWSSRGHFFAAAAEAMRRILVEQARRKSRVRHGGEWKRAPMVELAAPRGLDGETVLDVHEALDELGADDAVAADVVKLHFFAGLTLEETAEALGMSRATVYREWAYARARIRSSLSRKAP